MFHKSPLKARSPVAATCLGDLPRHNSMKTGAVRRRKPREAGRMAGSPVLRPVHRSFSEVGSLGEGGKASNSAAACPVLFTAVAAWRCFSASSPALFRSGLAFIACSAHPRAGRGWPAVWLFSRRTFSPKTIFAGRHTAPDSKSLSNTSEAAKIASPPASARRRCWTNPCASESRPTSGATSVWVAPISPATSGNAFVRPPVPACDRRANNR